MVVGWWSVGVGGRWDEVGWAGSGGELCVGGVRL